MALQNQTFANSGSAYYGNPADWSKFSTINDTILFNDTNAKIVVIPAVPDSATTITFNGEQLAYVSDLPNLANWAQYPANHDVDIPAPYSLKSDTAFISTATISSLTVTEKLTTPLLENSTITILANNQNFPLESPTLNITSKNGLGGNITVKADSGTGFVGGGLITLDAEGGTGLLGLNGAIDLIAKSGSSAVVGVTTGGRIDITATSGINDLFLTSAIKLSAAGINIQSGVTSPITSVLGYTFIGGNLGVNSCAGIPAIIPNVPGENYIYGLNGIVLDGDVYTSDVYPKWDGVSNPDDLILHGRTVDIGFGPYNAMVEIENVSQIAFETTGFRTGGAITGISSINGLNTGASGSIQYSDGLGAFQGNSNLKYNGTSRITNSNGANFIDINDTANVNSIAIQTPNQVNITAGPVIGINSAEALYLTAGTFFKVEIANSPGTVGQVLVSDGTYTNWQSIPAVGGGFVDAYQIYVAPNGNDTTGNGSQQNPFLTIQRAITKRATISNTIEVSIILSSGTYTPVGGGIVLSQNTFLVGIPTGELNQPVNVVCQIALQAGTGQCTLFGLSLFPASSQCVVINGVGTHNISNCNITGTGNYCVAQSLGTLFMTNCRINGPSTGSLPAIGGIGATAITIMRDCLVTTTGNNSLIDHIGTLTMRQCNLINSSSSILVKPLIIYSPILNLKSLEISYSSLEYTSAVSAVDKICVRVNVTGVGITAVITNFVNNLLQCEGAQSGTGPNNFHCVDKTGLGTATMKLGNCLAGNTAHQIDANITHTQYSAVV
jgi:hypothetical protein